jgi:hypothetical protein
VLASRTYSASFTLQSFTISFSNIPLKGRKAGPLCNIRSADAWKWKRIAWLEKTCSCMAVCVPCTIARALVDLAVPHTSTVLMTAIVTVQKLLPAVSNVQAAGVLMQKNAVLTINMAIYCSNHSIYSTDFYMLLWRLLVCHYCHVQLMN